MVIVEPWVPLLPTLVLSLNYPSPSGANSMNSYDNHYNSQFISHFCPRSSRSRWIPPLQQSCTICQPHTGNSGVRPRSDCSRSWPWVVGDGLFNNLETPVPARRLQAPQVVASGHVISCKSGEFTVRRPPPSDRVRRGRSRARNPGRHPGRTSSPSGRPSDCRTHPMRNLRRPIPGRLLPWNQPLPAHYPPRSLSRRLRPPPCRPRHRSQSGRGTVVERIVRTVEIILVLLPHQAPASSRSCSSFSGVASLISMSFTASHWATATSYE